MISIDRTNNIAQRYLYIIIIAQYIQNDIIKAYWGRCRRCAATQKGGKCMEEKPKVSKAQQRAQNKWIAKAYDRINLTVPKGRKDEIKAHAEAQGESVNGFIGRAIDETMERDRKEPE